MKTSSKVGIAVVVIAIIAIVALVIVRTTSHAPQTAGTTATTNLPSLGTRLLQVGVGCDDFFSTCTGGTSITTTTFTQGPTGTAFTQINGGFCYIKAYATTISASSTAQVDCQATAAVDASTGRIGSALTGVNFGDKVVASLATTTAAGGGVWGGLDLVGVTASTTNGYITFLLYNSTGATYTWPTSGTATGTASYIDFR